MKILPFLIILVIAAGLYYVWQNDDERGPHEIFLLIEKDIKPLAQSLSEPYINQHRLTPRAPRQRNASIDTPSEIYVNYQITVAEQAIIVTLQSDDERLNQKQIWFEPALQNPESAVKLVWLCSGGDLLMRYRSKGCRTGTGLKLTKAADGSN